MTKDVELKSVDEDHFYFGDVLIDLPQLRFERDNLNAPDQASKKWFNIHQRNSAIYMLSVYSRYLSLNKNLDLVTPKNVAKYIKIANELNLHTGVKL
jgi:hypothetical protein